MVDFLLYAASFEASVATRSKISKCNVRMCVTRHGGRLEHTIDERVQDRHGSVGDTSVWVNLLENCR